jgi:hypothetical protein
MNIDWAQGYSSDFGPRNWNWSNKPIQFRINKVKGQFFSGYVRAFLYKVDRGTKAAVTEAVNEIAKQSLIQVPKDTGTLASSLQVEVFRTTTGFSPKTWQYGASIYYGGNGDPVNPENLMPASTYMMTVHEDLAMYHVAPTKAKFLEDPVREYAENRLAADFAKNCRNYWYYGSGKKMYEEWDFIKKHDVSGHGQQPLREITGDPSYVHSTRPIGMYHNNTIKAKYKSSPSIERKTKDPDWMN